MVFARNSKAVTTRGLSQASQSGAFARKISGMTGASMRNRKPTAMPQIKPVFKGNVKSALASFAKKGSVNRKRAR